MGFKRRAEPTTVEDERDALRAQHAALEDLKHELAERVDAVKEREAELARALADANGPRPTRPVAPLPVTPNPDLSAREREAERREQAIAERERDLELQAERVPTLPAATPEAAQLAEIETRLAELDGRLADLRAAETLFLRTRDELAGRSEAVAARERLIAQRERELDDREDGKGEWAKPGLSEMEARLRRLEQQQPGEQTLGFSGGFRKLEQGSRPQREG